MRNKLIIRLKQLLPAFLTLFLLAGCQGKSDAELSSEWELVEFTVRDNTTKASELDPDLKALAPAFRCEDGKNCVVSNSGKDHPGTVEESDGAYVIRFRDTEETMRAQISGDTLTLNNSKGTVTFVFRAE